ncbi:MAG: NADH-quinone oxidoreductase subunit NuoE [Clostridiales bacterium]|jgi:NADP-reducing hydrogenase subunit HndA|nr:NADH-quinone oxidoreductase subunit NuoE [Clostridiales bacterium]
MAKEFIDTPEKAKRLEEALAELQNARGPLMMALQRAQEIYGYLPFEVQNRIAEKFGVPLEEIYGIATFYSQFKLDPSGKYTVGVCMGTACYVKGSGGVLKKITDSIGIEPGQTTSDGKYSLNATRCIGCCGLAPVITVNDDVYGKVTPDEVAKILAKYGD